MKKKSSSSRRWLKEHFSDPYVKKAQQAGYRSRSVYKLLEMQERYQLFKPGMTIVDLGAAPGGWSQLLSEWIKPTGQIVALDILPMEPLKGVQFIQGDFTEEKVLSELMTHIPHSVDWVLSDMAPNLSGNANIDIPRSMNLVELALNLAMQILKPGGGLLIKVFQGEGFDSFLAELRTNFQSVIIRKPKASRGRSREVYLIARKISKAKPVHHGID